MGVKSLWSLLDPVGRPVLLETMEGKAMAIDSSIWIYQFQATMRDKEGRGLVNAHVLGFLRRICKLLFYGIKPVFVFDGGAPALKRATIAERKKKKSGAALSHAKVAERLLAAQMRREALNNVQSNSSERSKGKGKAPTGPVVLDENTVYLEDLDNSIPNTPAKKGQKEAAEPSPPSSKKKSRWHDHDPYKLPEVDLDEVVAKATRSSAPDPRLATEEELRTFIEEMRPEDFDVSSPAFRELPTEVQYEIIGDLRLKSRQTSYKRLQNMLRNAKTPLDFSKEQIKNLKNRNNLTQQLLFTTDSIGKANVTIPIRIASERNKEYILVKNEGEAGGWVLGIRDEGTRSKPIEIDVTNDKEKGNASSDQEDMEEVEISDNVPFDPDLREFRRARALSALAERYTPKQLTPLKTKVPKRQKSRPLFVPEEDELIASHTFGSEEDPELALAIQESLEHEEESNLQKALQASRSEVVDTSPLSNIGASTSRSTIGRTELGSGHAGRLDAERESDDEDLYASPTRLETALSIANAGPSRRPLSQSRRLFDKSSPRSSMFGLPTLLVPQKLLPSSAPAIAAIDETVSSSDGDMEEVPLVHAPEIPFTHVNEVPSKASPKYTAGPTQQSPLGVPHVAMSSDSDGDMEEVVSSITLTVPRSFTPSEKPARSRSPNIAPVYVDEDQSLASGPSLPGSTLNVSESSATATEAIMLLDEASFQSVPDLHTNHDSNRDVADATLKLDDFSDSENEASDPWISPSPVGPSQNGAVPQEPTVDGWDAAEEMDPQAEEGEFARFLSQVKGKDIATIRSEIDEEIRALNQQKKVAMRDSEDVTQQMISQIMIMLRLFGIPYITAPMEAEAQCAELLGLGLVDGIITDDSDVFLFGGMRVLKDMFNQSKTVECFFLSDLERELGLDRDKLIRLAYLLGSDYTDGLPGVGPVVAMELLTEFPGQDGLHKFKHWWQKVQNGKDTSEDTNSKFRTRFKKRFKDLYIPDDWPNPAVRDAYYHPTVDESEEPFKWGLPDLDALRDFFNSELGWHQTKVDDLLLPIIRKMGKRGQVDSRFLFLFSLLN
ncbi:hypothetical protein AcW1_008124 [Taiwanofungus camphoratus]|nr:hypothetical protein AcV5_008425 [Antrodia cinnamomea]KAI0950959.1 hypothetical protein AcW1_008124 [Antrodia cinnamomea]